MRPVHSEGVTDQDADATIAKLFAVAARNAVEDLHATGAFSDAQAPALNRRIRSRIYELRLAVQLSDPYMPDDPFTIYVDKLVEGHRGGRMVAALQGAVGQAVDDFAAAESIDAATAGRLRKAAIKGAVEAYKTTTRLSLGRSKDEAQDRFAVNFWLMSIPSYWEEPEVSADLQRLLDARRPRQADK